jgi:hypothetical protein
MRKRQTERGREREIDEENIMESERTILCE